MNRKKIVILGATGSIGLTTLRVLRMHKDRFELVGISANRSAISLCKIAEEFGVKWIHLMSEKSACEAKNLLSQIPVYHGLKDLLSLIADTPCDLVLAAMVGNIGLLPVLKAIDCGIHVALANKETLVAGGEVVKKHLCTSAAKLIPVDSEHSAIFQCLHNEQHKSIRKIILTASGGAFRTWSAEEMKNVTANQALKHPNWDMGAKITIDSATMMNKGFEVIEAHHLFNLAYEQIETMIHPQSVVHSLVEFHDHSTLAQLSLPDMAIPISFALNWPERLKLEDPKPLDLAKLSHLDFYAPDLEKFRCLQLAFSAGKEGKTLPAVLNAANEITVQMFLEGRISFLDIAEINEEVMNVHKIMPGDCIENILEADRFGRETARKIIEGKEG